LVGKPLFYSGKPLQPRLMFASKAGAELLSSAPGLTCEH
jgi:hypothetical protein